MADGFLNKCKDCKKKHAIIHRRDNIEKVRAYDRDRGNRHSQQYLSDYRSEYPNKYKAHTKLSNCLRSGKIKKVYNCSDCGSDWKIEAHHNDYLKPLDVTWFCNPCHKQWHAKNGEGLNGK